MTWCRFHSFLSPFSIISTGFINDAQSSLRRCSIDDDEHTPSDARYIDQLMIVVIVIGGFALDLAHDSRNNN